MVHLPSRSFTKVCNKCVCVCAQELILHCLVVVLGQQGKQSRVLGLDILQVSQNSSPLYTGVGKIWSLVHFPDPFFISSIPCLSPSFLRSSVKKKNVQLSDCKFFWNEWSSFKVMKISFLLLRKLVSMRHQLKNTCFIFLVKITSLKGPVGKVLVHTPGQPRS